MHLKTKFGALLLSVLFCSVSASALNISVQALFSGTAVFSIDGRTVTLKVGQTSDQGVRLIEADSNQAVVEYRGQQQTISLSDHIGSSFETPEKAQVMINMDANRQYITHGSINGRAARFLVDTGANVVALNSRMAASLGLSIADGVKTHASTASSRTEATVVTIRQMQVGAIKAANVRAIIIDGDYPTDILLGMTFLQHVDISENAGLMVLTSKL